MRFFAPLTAAVASLAVASTVFAAAAGPAPKSVGSATAQGLSPASLAGFVQAKGPRPGAELQGAVKVKLISEFAAPAAHGTGVAPDVATFASLLPGKNVALQGLMAAGQNNALLLNGLTSRK